MKRDITDYFKARIMDEKFAALEDTLKVLRGDLVALLSDYMDYSGDVYMSADVDEKSSNILLTIKVNAREVFDCGRILKA